MKKNTVMSLVKTIGLMACFLCILTHGCLAESANAASAKDIYDLMIQAVNEGNWSDAFERAEQLHRTNPDFNDAEKYYSYLLARDSFVKSDFTTAYGLFQDLASLEFRDSGAYLKYIEGRKYHLAQEYAAAQACYIDAQKAGIDVDHTYLNECKIKLQQEAYDEGVRLEMDGDFLGAAKVFEAEDLVFFEDSLTRKKVNYFRYADTLFEQGKYEEAREIYLTLKTFEYNGKKASDKASECYGLVKIANARTDNLLTISCENNNARTLTLSWNNLENITDYTVTFYPGVMKTAAQTILLNTNRCTLENLLPNTPYHIAITTAQETGIVIGETDITTKQAAAITDFKVDMKKVVAYKTIDAVNRPLFYVYDGGYSQSVDTSGGAYVIQLNKNSALRDGENSLMTNLMLFFDKAVREQAKEYKTLFVLHSGKSYVLSKEDKHQYQGGNASNSNFTEISSLLDGLYDLEKCWPVDETWLDVYFDDQFCTRIDLRLNVVEVR